MGYTLAEKIIKRHLVSGKMKKGEEIALRMCQTLTQDSTGTMAYLQLEAIGVPRVQTEKSVAYIDHNTLQAGFENADDHAYIQSVARKHGVYVSKPGNGICHQIHLERFAVPGKTLIGSDSHTPTAGGIGMLAIGAGGLDVAVSMGGGAYYLTMPEIFGVRLSGRLTGNASAKDVILEVLRQLTVKGGVGKIIEYYGEGVATLSVPERATITNMGAELGATTSIFPSDSVTRAFLKAQGRAEDFVSLKADGNAIYSGYMEIDLSKVVPLAACPHSPDLVKTVSELSGKRIDQVCVGSCTNSSLLDMLKVAAILKGKTVADNVSLTISPGSRQVYQMLAECGALSDIAGAGARILECACGPCIGMGQAPKTGGVSLRTFNRNFYARSGTASAEIYLVSPETAALSALKGEITCPNTIEKPTVSLPKAFKLNDNLILSPEGFTGEIERGPNILPFPRKEALKSQISGEVLIRLPDNITTDHIAPSNAKLLPYRSNIPFLADFCLSTVDEGFAARAKLKGGGIIVAGENYGQGSSREHAALIPVQLNISCVLAKSFARIHRDNLINNGILPLVFDNASDYDNITEGDSLVIGSVKSGIKAQKLTVLNTTTSKTYLVSIALSKRQQAMLMAGGLLNSTRIEAQKNGEA